MRGERRMRRCEREIDQINRDGPFPEFQNSGPKQNQRDDKKRFGSNYLRICLSCFVWVRSCNICAFYYGIIADIANLPFVWVRNFNIGAAIAAYSQVVLSDIWHSGL